MARPVADSAYIEPIVTTTANRIMCSGGFVGDSFVTLTTEGSHVPSSRGSIFVLHQRCGGGPSPNDDVMFDFGAFYM